LDVGHNQLGNEGVEYLADALKINRVSERLFSFDRSSSRDPSFHSQSLTTLDIQYNDIDAEGETDLANALNSNQVRFDLVV
jgi:Ran GTPase-activating protein (RanGAP) involved in mRNA processing and transport